MLPRPTHGEYEIRPTPRIVALAEPPAGELSSSPSVRGAIDRTVASGPSASMTDRGSTSLDERTTAMSPMLRMLCEIARSVTPRRPRGALVRRGRRARTRGTGPPSDQADALDPQCEDRGAG